MKAFRAKYPLVFDNITPFPDTVNSENKECNAILLKYGSSILAASVLVPKSQSLFRDILHLFSRRSVCKSLKLFLSPETSNRCFGPPGASEGPFCSNTNFIKSSKQRLFFKQIKCLCCLCGQRN